jgi:predicted dehydrogenase
MAQTIRWGILGTGNIAHQFARGLSALEDAELVAVGSRSQAAADAFGDEFGVAHRHPSYEALADDPDVDAIYISTPHPFHRDNSLLCLEAGKAVLCEKPFAINARQAQEVIAYARKHKRFLMEAMWTRFLPTLVRVRELLAEHAIGEVRMLTADFGFRTRLDPHGRLFDPALGGGALLDVGVYPVALASMVFGTPTRVASLAHLGETGVDEQSGTILGYEAGQLALVSSAIRTNTPQEAVILGTEGSITLNSPWWKGNRLTLARAGKESEQFDLSYPGNGYNCEAAEVGRCLREGKLESDVMPLDETITIMQTMDLIRSQWGLKYPME